MIKHILNALLFSLMLAGCADVSTGNGKNVKLIGSLSPTEAKNYIDLGTVDCGVFSKVPDADEACRNQLKNNTDALGGDVVVIESRIRIDCFPEKSEDCVQMTAKAYRKKIVKKP